MLGFRFAPRLRSATEQYLYTVAPTLVAEPLTRLMKGAVDTGLIRENRDKMRRLAASIRHGRESAALIIRKLAAIPARIVQPGPFAELGKLKQTLFVLQYLPDEALQQRIQRELNKGETMYALPRRELKAKRFRIVGKP